MEGYADNRAYPRLRIDFAVEVVSEDASGGKRKIKAVLSDVSGGGASFMTADAGCYFPGQSLEIAICLPGATDVGALMKGRAMVLRVESSAAKDRNEKNQGIVAIRIEEPLHLERLR